MAKTTGKSPRLKIKKIAIVGAGGIGAYTARLLFDFGVNRNQYPYTEWTIDVFDNDAVDAKNLLHQDYSFDDLGKSKAKIVAERYSMNAIERFMTPDDFKDYDLIFCCVDSMKFRKQLYEYGWKNPGKVVWIDGRCSSRNIGVYHSLVAKSILEKDITDNETRTGCLRQVDKENDISHVTPVVVASMMIQVFLNIYRGEQVDNKILLMI